MKEKVSIVSNVWIKQMEFTGIGDVMEGHKHLFDHQTLLAFGEFDVTVDGHTSHFVAPHIVFIRKGKEHSIKCTTESGVGYCIHPIRDGEKVEDIVDPDSMPMVGGVMKQPLISD